MGNFKEENEYLIMLNLEKKDLLRLSMEISKSMLDALEDIFKISKYSGLTIEEINNLQFSL